MARLAGCAVVGLGLGMAARPALAQISPGRLSRGHARLEGSAHCLDCHEPKRGASPAKCLACHTALAGTGGLHARPEYRDCGTCHVEHQGEETSLVWWGKAGRAAFDHATTGHPLQGRHASLPCESCHQQRLVKQPERLRGGGVDPARTFLGLGADCASCHADPHRGTRLAAGRACASCHAQQSWKPAAFDHARTAFALAGAHASVPCASCHAVRTGEPVRRADAAGPAARQCAACHADPHQGRLGAACANCHSATSWRGLAAKGFDHSRTRYPLEGRHAAVACAGCHRAGHPLRPGRAACTECHSDVHLGQLAAAGRTECERCHDVGGFTPARFTTERHQAGRFPLQGAHLAVSCDRCHRRLPPAELARKVPGLAASAGTRPTAQFRFAAAGCRDCHGDPHRGELPRAAGAECTACHTVDSWHAAFDHGRTRFALTGPHARAACDKCHPPVAAGTRGARLKLGGLDTACQSCHRDPHQGQFARAAVSRACESCHAGAELRATGFDHARDSGFPLAGAHARADCSACHRRETRGGVEVTRYRPVPTACSACHAAAPAAGAAP